MKAPPSALLSRIRGDLGVAAGGPWPQVPAGLQWLAMAALAFQAFFAMTHFGMQLRPEYGAGVLLIALCFVGRMAWRELLAQPVTQALLLFTAFLLGQAIYATRVMPSIGYSEQLSTASKLVRLGVFSCVIGWWLSLLPRAIPYLFALMVVGLLTAVLVYMPWTQLSAVWDGQLRPRFGVPENLGGLLAALGGWLALCFIIALWRGSRDAGRRTALLSLGLLAYATCFCALLFSQSRGAWLALLLTSPVILFGLWWTRRRKAALWAPLLLVALATGLVLWSAHDILSVRLASSVGHLLESNEEQAPASSLSTAPVAAQSLPSHQVAREPEGRSVAGVATAGVPSAAHSPQPDVAAKAVDIRMQMYRLGFDKWREHPWLGWGLRSIPTLIATAALDTNGALHVHLHNAYLDVLVGLGLVGALLLGLMFVLLIRELLLAWRGRLLSTASLWAFAGCIGIVLVANLFDSMLWRFEFARAPLEILCGCCVAYGLIRRRRGVEAGIG